MICRKQLFFSKWKWTFKFTWPFQDISKRRHFKPSTTTQKLHDELKLAYDVTRRSNTTVKNWIIYKALLSSQSFFLHFPYLNIYEAYTVDPNPNFVWLVSFHEDNSLLVVIRFVIGIRCTMRTFLWLLMINSNLISSKLCYEINTIKQLAVQLFRSRPWGRK